MGAQETTQPLRFRYRTKLRPTLVAFAASLIFGGLLVHSARSGLGAPSRGLGLLFRSDPALLWWSGAVVAFGAALLSLKMVIDALGPGQTITLTDGNLIFSGRSSANRERIPYRSIEHVRCVDTSTTEATLIIKFGRSEKRLTSGRFDALPDFYAFWSALRTHLNPELVQSSDPEGFDHHGSTKRAVAALLGPKPYALAAWFFIAVAAGGFVFKHWFAGAYRSPLADLPAPRVAPTVVAADVGTPRPIFLSERIITEIQRSEFARLHLEMPPYVRLEQTSWVVDRRQQIYFVAQGGNPALEIPYRFALVLPRQGITVQVEGQSAARGPVEPGGVEIDWNITSVKVPKEHAAKAPRCLELVRQALQAYGYYGDTALAKTVRVRLPPPTFT